MDESIFFRQHQNILREHDRNRFLDKDWSRPTNERCLSCGRLGRCECRVHIDPATKKSRQAAVLCQTPFERAKLLKRLDGALSSEATARKELKAEESAVWANLTLLAEKGRNLVMVPGLEEIYRESIEDQWFACLVLQKRICSRRAEQINLLDMERTRRASILRVEMLQRKMIFSGHEVIMRQQNLFVSEHFERCVLANNEEDTFSKLLLGEQEGREIMSVFGRYRWALFEQALESFREICAEEDMLFNQLISLFHQGQQAVHHMYEEREQLFAECYESHRKLRDLQSVEHHQIVRYEVEMREAVSQMLVLFQQQQKVLIAEEERHRYHWRDHEVCGRDELFELAQESKEAAIQTQAEKARQRADALSYSISQLNVIRNEECDQFGMLMAWFRTERDQVELFVAAKAEERSQFEKQVAETLSSIATIEECEFSEIIRSRKHEEELVLAWIQEKANYVAQRAEAAIVEHMKLSLTEIDARHALRCRMDAEEEEVHHWVASKSDERSAIVGNESHDRAGILAKEGDAWFSIGALFNEGIEAIDAWYDAQQNERRKLEAEEIISRHSWTQFEGIAFENLVAEEGIGHYTAYVNQCARECSVVCCVEMEARSAITFEQGLEADCIRCACQKELFNMSQAFILEWNRTALELEMEHAAGTAALLREYENEQFSLARREKISREEAIAEELFRIRAEYAARQARMLEDERLYTEEEPLPDARLSYDSIRNSRGSFTDEMATMAFNTDVAYITEQLGSVGSSFSQEFCSQAADVALLLRTIEEHVEQAEGRHSTEQQRIASKEKQLVQATAAYESKVEQCEFYRRKVDNDAAEFTKRLDAEKELRKKDERQWGIERRKAAETHEQLMNANKRANELRDAIHGHFTR